MSILKNQANKADTKTKFKFIKNYANAYLFHIMPELKMHKLYMM